MQIVIPVFDDLYIWNGIAFAFEFALSEHISSNPPIFPLGDPSTGDISGGFKCTSFMRLTIITATKLLLNRLLNIIEYYTILSNTLVCSVVSTAMRP